MTTAVPSPTLIFRAFDNNGLPLVGGLLYTYAAGTSTPQASYPSSSELTPNTNPIVLNFRGECALWLDPTLSYKINLTDSLGNTIPGYPVDNVAGFGVLLSQNLTQSIVGIVLYPQTSSELAVNVTPVNYAYPPGNILRYGADPTGGTASDAAFALALSVVGPSGTNGGTIFFPSGTYLFANPWNLNQLSGVTIEGEGNATGGAGPGTDIKYSGTGSGHWIVMTSCGGCALRRMTLQATSASLTGAILRCGNDGVHGDSSLCYVEDITWIGSIGSYHIDLDKVSEFSASRCNFTGGAVSIKGAPPGSYSNVVTFDTCRWGGATAAPVNGLVQSWAFRSCTFEPLSNGAAGGIVATNADGVVIEGCWFGDANATAGSWVSGLFQCALISGNVFGGNTGGTIALDFTSAAGVAIIGNNFQSCLTCISFSSGSQGIVAKSNINNNSINSYVGTDTHLNPGGIDFQVAFGMGIPTGQGGLGASGYRCHPDGSIEQWGVATSQSHGNNTVTFPLQFPHNCYNVVCTLSAVAATTATIYAGTLSTASFVATIADGTSTTDSFYWRAIGN